MNSPVHPDTVMHFREIEPGLAVHECPKSGGLWIPLESYLTWKEKCPSVPNAVTENPAPVLPEEPSIQRALICPESGRLLLRYRVGQGLPFHIDRSPATGGVWLDKGEWEALKSKGLHVSLHLIFTAAYQRQVRSTEYAKRMAEAFRSRIGTADFSKVAEFATWLAGHPRRRDICCFLLDTVEQRTEGMPTAGSLDASAAARS